MMRRVTWLEIWYLANNGNTEAQPMLAWTAECASGVIFVHIKVWLSFYRVSQGDSYVFLLNCLSLDSLSFLANVLYIYLTLPAAYLP